MLQFDEKLDLDTLIKSKNIAKELSDETCAQIANHVYSAWSIDKNSRDKWEQNVKEDLDLAMQVVQEKSFPWPHAANVKFPLITVAALQLHSRMYPALISGSDLVKTKVFTEDEKVIQRARRIERHMSYQLLEEDEDWEAHQDKNFLIEAIVGTSFKKSYFCTRRQHNVSILVHPKDLFIPYFAPSLSAASRVTEQIYLSSNDIRQRVVEGIYREHDTWTDAAVEGSDVLETQAQEAEGISKPSNDPLTPFTLLEQHTWLDLDGDGYSEPYIITVRKDTRQLMRIVARYDTTSIKKTSDGRIYSIEPDEYYTQYTLIPSPDGGVYGMGFGTLLRSLNHSINTIVNQLTDAGTLSNTAGGFLGRGAKFRSGDNSFRPFEWKKVDSTGDDLHKSIIPLPVREPSDVLFKLLGLLISYGERVGMATDPMVGENPGQNTPAETSRNMISEGQKLFNGIFKRNYRAFTEELRKLYKLNQIYMKSREDFQDAAGDVYFANKDDYIFSSKVIKPAADPHMISDSERLNQATMIKQAAMSVPGYDKYEVEKNFLKAIRVLDVDKLFPDPKGPKAVQTPPPLKMQIEQMKAQAKMMDSKLKNQLGMAKLMSEVDVNRAQIANLYAQAEKALAEAKGVPTGHAIALIESQIGAAKAHQDGLLKALEIMQKAQGESKDDHQGDVAGMGTERGDAGVSEVPQGPAE
jgi:chaperonin GroES